MHTIESAAIKLAQNKIMMKVYEDAENEKQQWIFTTNNALDGAVKKPASFPAADKNFNRWWRELHPAQKHVLYTYGNFWSWWTPFKDISKDHYEVIKEAYQKWLPAYYAVFYGTHIWSCNLFVGETLFIYGRNITRNGKYYSAHEIWEGFDPFKKVEKQQVKSGNIAAFGGKHVEIVTEVDHKRGTFCSRGAGRGGGDGVERCADRKIMDKEIRFYAI